MKKTFIFTMLLILSVTSFSQQTIPSKPITKSDFLQKSKKQKTTAWVMLGGGASLVLIGDLIGNSKNSSFDDAGTGVILGGIGVLSMLGSIPVFLASGKNKRRANAMSASIKMEKTEVIPGNGWVHGAYPSLAIKISL